MIVGRGGTVSLKLDAQGKTHALQVLRMDIDVPQELLSLYSLKQLQQFSRSIFQYSPTHDGYKLKGAKIKLWN